MRCQDKKLRIIFLSVVAALTIVCSSTMNMDLASATQDENQGNFIIRVTLVDDLDFDIDHIFYDLVNIYVKEYSQYGHFNMDLSDALYSDTSNGEYITEIIMPSGLIEVDEVFHICIDGPVTSGGNVIICYDLTNSPQPQPEDIIIRI